MDNPIELVPLLTKETCLLVSDIDADADLAALFIAGRSGETMASLSSELPEDLWYSSGGEVVDRVKVGACEFNCCWGWACWACRCMGVWNCGYCGDTVDDCATGGMGAWIGWEFRGVWPPCDLVLPTKVLSRESSKFSGGRGGIGGASEKSISIAFCGCWSLEMNVHVPLGSMRILLRDIRRASARDAPLAKLEMS